VDIECVARLPQDDMRNVDFQMLGPFALSHGPVGHCPRWRPSWRSAQGMWLAPSPA